MLINQIATTFKVRYPKGDNYDGQKIQTKDNQNSKVRVPAARYRNQYIKNIKKYAS
jgi:hypothetical protein